MMARIPHLPVVHLAPGKIHVTKREELVETILGSCVAVTLFDRSNHVGAICHALLPTPEGGAGGESSRHVRGAIRLMLSRMESMGAQRDRLEVKLFGGSGMFSADESGAEGLGVGKRNVEEALDCLASLGVHPAVRDVGGGCGRRIYFNTGDGAVYIRRLRGEGRDE